MVSSERTLLSKIYIPSYKRAGKVTTLDLLPDARLVVRASERDDYIAAYPIADVISPSDDEIDSLAKVRQWIIDSSDCDVPIVLDDDITCFDYCYKAVKQHLTPEQITMELLRVAQMLVDLHLGLASLITCVSNRFCSSEFRFSAVPGHVLWYNKDCLKARYDDNTFSKKDTDFMLQELLYNRIILNPTYLAVSAQVDSNQGGNNTNKSTEAIELANEYMCMKWGKAYSFSKKRNAPLIHVIR